MAGSLPADSQGCHAAFVLSGVGSLSAAGLRFAGAEQPQRLSGDMEILSLSGSVARNGAHLHMALSTATGQVFGGHVAQGCIVRTTAEVLLALLPEWAFAREPDVTTGYDELVLRPAPKPDGRSGDPVRAKLAGLDLKDADVADAVAWARKSHQRSTWACCLVSRIAVFMRPK